MQNINIRTSYSGPTDTRGARIVAVVTMTTDDGHKVRRQRTVPYDHAHNSADLHEVVARDVASLFKWHGDLACREVRPGTDYVFTGCVVVRGLTVAPDGGLLGPTKPVDRSPVVVFFTNHGRRA